MPLSTAFDHLTDLGLSNCARTALGVGQGDWSQTDSVADDVKIVIRLEAKQVP